MSKPLLQTQNLSINFGGVRAVSGVSLDIQEGQLHVIIGPNGAGKTTFFHLLTGVYSPTEGAVLFKGQDITALSPAERVKLGIARSYQRTNVFPRLTVRENLRLAASRSYGKGWSVLPRAPSADVTGLVEETLELLKLTDVADSLTQTLPYGVQRLIDIGIALCCRPTLLLLDEPTSGLSTAELLETAEVLKLVSQKVTVLLIEHNMELVVGMANHISVLNFGELLAQGTPAEISANQDVQDAYFGSRRGTVTL